MTDKAQAGSKKQLPVKKGKKPQPATDMSLPVAGRTVPKIAIEDGALAIHGGEESQLAVDQAFGTGSRDFVAYGMLQLVNFIRPKSGEDQDLTGTVNAAMAFLRAIGPTNEVESLLAVQMFATHHLAMDITGRASRANGLQQYEAHGNLSTKLMRTFTTQLEALGRHRRGGRQTVEHVHVGAGGQAVIANTVNTGGPKNG